MNWRQMNDRQQNGFIKNDLSSGYLIIFRFGPGAITFDWFIGIA